MEETLEQVAKAIYINQRLRLKDQTSIAAMRPWRCSSVPDIFWNGYISDAKAAIEYYNFLRQVELYNNFS